MRGSISQTVKQLGGGLAALGVRVDKLVADIPQEDGTDDLFIIRNGKILLTSLIGQVVTPITAVGAANMYLQLAYTKGAGGTQDITDSPGPDIGGDIADTIYLPTGAVGVDIDDDAGVGAYLASMGTNLLLLQQGTIQIVCGGTETGTIKWLLHYIAIDSNAYVVPAP